MTKINNRKYIIIEPFMENQFGMYNEQIHCYCFYSKPKLSIRIDEGINSIVTLYDDKLNIIKDTLSKGDRVSKRFDDNINQTFDLCKKTNKYPDISMEEILKLSTKLSRPFKFVRVDWMVYKGKFYFEELTFSPYSGFSRVLKSKYNEMMGDWIGRKLI